MKVANKVRNSVILDFAGDLAPIIETKCWYDVERRLHSSVYEMFNNHRRKIMRRLTDASEQKDKV